LAEPPQELSSELRERNALERAHVAQALRSERLLKVTGAIAEAVTREQVFAALVDHVAEALRASSAALWLVAEDRTAKLVRARGYSDVVRAQFANLHLDTVPPLPITEAMARGEAVWIPSQAALLERYPHLRDMAAPGCSYRVRCLPLRNQGGVIGALSLTMEDADEAAESEREFLLLVARYASQALERLRLLEAARRSRDEADAAAQRLAVLGRASRAFAEPHLDLQSRLQAVAVALGALLDSSVNIGLIEADGALRIRAAHHPDPEAHRLLREQFSASTLRVGEGATGAIAASGESVLLPHIDQGMIAARAAPAYRAFLERFPAFALIGAALKVRGRVIGTVTASRVRAGQTYTAEDLRLLEELADRAAITIENARLYHETLDAGARAQQLYSFAQAAVEAENVEAVFAAALDSIQRATGATRSAVLTFDERGVMRFRAWRGLSDDYRRAVEGHSPWPRDAIAPQPALVPDVGLDPALSAYGDVLRAEGIAALCFIPLLSDGRLLGKFMVYFNQPRTLRTQEIEAAQAIGHHLASMVVRFGAAARLHETLRANELFAGVLAHDLRNPLSAIMSAAHVVLAQRDGAAEDDREYKPLSRILASGRRMANMIEQLLDFTRVRSGGGIEIRPHDSDLADLCKDAIEELELAHPDWKLLREVHGDTRGSWDAQRIVQVLSNLLANAGQHGSGGTIRILIDGSMPEQVRVRVHNDGAIAVAVLPHLFDPLGRSDPRQRRTRGLGLGLFIVREIVHAHGGTLHVSSAEHTGTSVTLDLPRRARPSVARLGA
jgi:K+-sensing histidine kinase KdpD